MTNATQGLQTKLNKMNCKQFFQRYKYFGSDLIREFNTKEIDNLPEISSTDCELLAQKASDCKYDILAKKILQYQELVINREESIERAKQYLMSIGDSKFQRKLDQSMYP